MSEPQIDIRPDHWAIVRDILQRHVPQYAVWAFGSRAKWTAKEYSDLDLAIITASPLPLATSAALAEDFSESDLPWKVDIVDWAETSETFRKIIERDRVVVQDIGWTYITLGELVSLQRGHDLTEEERHPGTIPVMGSAGQNGYHNKSLVKGPGIVIGRSGASFGQVHFCTKDYWPHNTTLYVTNFYGNNPYFTYYLLRNLDFTRYNSGSAQPSLNRNYIYPIKIKIPPIKEQCAIAHILGTFDDRIELNRRMNETLEAMARSLFKSWFVDFDGVPAEDMQESELGLIPNGWQVASLDSIADYLNGLALQKFPPESEVEFLPVIKIAQLRAGNTNNADKASSRLKPEYIVEDGDVLFSWSGSLEVEIWTGGRGALNQHLFKVTSSKVPKWFYYFATRQYLADFRAIAASKATTMGHIQRKHLTDAKISVPSPEAMENFDCTIAPLFEQIIKTSLQSKALAQLRDTLLPKLISGEVRIKDAERLAETA
nr:restriction endonuclease subunit S [uncultured Pseudomonas sp.]